MKAAHSKAGKDHMKQASSKTAKKPAAYGKKTVKSMAKKKAMKKV
jgi:hypothetical protein